MKFLVSTCVFAFGLLLNTQAAYLMAIDQDDSPNEDASENWTINIFDTDDANNVTSYALPSGLIEVENLVYDSANNVAYGFQSIESASSSTLYKFILSDAGVEATELGSYNMGDIDSITIAGENLYTINNDYGTLYSIGINDLTLTDLGEVTSVTTRALGNSGKFKTTTTLLDDVQGLTSDGVDTLYAIDDGVLYSMDLDGSDVTKISTTGVSLSGVEGLAYSDGTLYATHNDELYKIDLTSYSVSSVATLGWADDIEGLSSYALAATGVPEPGSVLAWLLAAGGVALMIRRKRATA
jgi:hypothetical protein